MRITSFAIDLPTDWYGQDSPVPDELRPLLEEAGELDRVAGTDSLLTAFWVTAPGTLRGQLQVFDAAVDGVSPRKLVRLTRRSPVDGVLLERDVREIAVPTGPAVVDGWSANPTDSSRSPSTSPSCRRGASRRSSCR